MITQFGINMLVPIFLCTFLGIFIDKKLGTKFVVIILFFLGAAAGARNIYIFAKGIYDKPRFQEHPDDKDPNMEKQDKQQS